MDQLIDYFHWFYNFTCVLRQRSGGASINMKISQYHNTHAAAGLIRGFYLFPRSLSNIGEGGEARMHSSIAAVRGHQSRHTIYNWSEKCLNKHSCHLYQSFLTICIFVLSNAGNRQKGLSAMRKVSWLRGEMGDTTSRRRRRSVHLFMLVNVAVPHSVSSVVLHTIHRFHIRFSQSRKRPLL